jgi:hypothetical protein
MINKIAVNKIYYPEYELQKTAWVLFTVLNIKTSRRNFKRAIFYLELQ